MRDRYRLDLSDEEFDALAPEPGTFARTVWQELRVGRPLARAESERDALAARLAEVEGQARLSNARAMELEAERDEARRRLAEVERSRESVLARALTERTAERDRLAQELEGAVGQADGLRAVLAVVTDVTIETIARLGGQRYGGDWAERCARGENELRALYEDMRLESFWAKNMYGESGALGTAREFLARFPREGDKG